MTLTIPLRPSVTSLVITITSLVVELACLSALFIFNAVCECRSLRNGNRVSVARHRLRIKILTILATLTFVGLEVITSANSHTKPVTESTLSPCIRSVTKQNFDNINSSFDDQTVTNGRDNIGISCVNVGGGEVFVKNGNYSLDTLDVQCGAKPIFSYVSAEKEFLPPASPGVITHCEQDEFLNMGTCASVSLQNKTRLLISERFSEESNFEIDAEFRPTQLFMTIGEDQLESIAKQLLTLYTIGVSDEAEVRRRILTDGIRSQCSFDAETHEFTEIKLWAFILTVIIWAMCITFFLVMLFVRRGVFYDMSNALHWAEKTVYRQLEDDTGTEKGQVRMFVELKGKTDGRTLVAVVHEQVRSKNQDGPENHSFQV
ncbi:hypothetical protein BWQ96_00504 [Gracilariopsis chorda]|uniref:Uncharacterized protein n=1 Tax=Gracilariopsis chorda TaxID=448386 RepID=A0A2V3J5B4_9FLOR|nr:hypothetical protein BWQ96_00504 [Gracilariopsis chorda]|eukprot:PXF49626.1 hypothetical protein BWQ96_00504 [Gracilariopsis chorda]